MAVAETLNPIDVAPVIELHALTDVETAHGFYWRRCSCGSLSPGFTYEESAEAWLCPNEVADALIEGYAERERAHAARKVASARQEWAQAQQHQPR
jgi:hypothetical protein